jgi:hypothetical protein
MSDIYDRIRNWQEQLGLWDIPSQLTVMVEEVGELDEAFAEHRVRDKYCDAVGDVTVTCVTLWGALQRQTPFPTGKLEEQPVPAYTPQVQRLASVVGKIAQGVRKRWYDKARQNIVLLHHMVQQDSARANVRFLEDCLTPVVAIIESRVAKGKVIDGTLIKEEDQRGH